MKLHLLIFFKHSIFDLQTCCSKKTIKAPIERDIAIMVIEIEVDDKNFSTVFKVSLNQEFTFQLFSFLLFDYTATHK